MQGEPVALVLRSNDGEGIGAESGARRNVGDHPPAGMPELQLAVRSAFDLVALLVDRPVVPTAQQREV